MDKLKLTKSDREVIVTALENKIDYLNNYLSCVKDADARMQRNSIKRTLRKLYKTY